jgi:hypothetical protein
MKAQMLVPGLLLLCLACASQQGDQLTQQQQDQIKSLGGQLKSGHLWTGQTRPFRQAGETVEFYPSGSSVRKSVCTFVRQLRGPHFSTCA